METQDKVPCVCGSGSMTVKVTIYGKWKVEEVVTPCDACESDDIQMARTKHPVEPPK